MRSLTLRLGCRVATGALVVSAATLTAPGISQAAPTYVDRGSVSSKNHVLRNGCHNYAFRWKVKPNPENDWYADIRLITPGGTTLASSMKYPESNGTGGTARWRVCKPSTRFGKHTITMDVVYLDRAEETYDEGMVRPATFTMLRPRRR